MAEASRQRILIGFETEQALSQALQSLETEALSTLEAEVVIPLDKDVPTERSLNSGIAQAAGLGAVMGAMAGGLIITTALNIPNIASISENATPLSVIVVLMGAVFGGLGGGAASFFSGANPDAETPANYKLRVEASSEEVKTATQVLLNEGGRLL